jgi:FAD/FMN-containing dehydrogenase
MTYSLLHSNARKGFANVEKGITIDLGSMNDIQFKQSGSIVAVGAGTRSQSVYEGLEPYNLTVQVGRNGDVGVAGFLTGGVYSITHAYSTDRLFFRRHRILLSRTRMGL